MTDKQLEILDLADDVRALIAECELTGKRTIFSREGRPAAILVSYDEYLALRETADIVGNAALLARITNAEAQVRKGAMLLVEDLLDIES